MRLPGVVLLLLFLFTPRLGVAVLERAFMINFFPAALDLFSLISIVESQPACHWRHQVLFLPQTFQLWEGGGEGRLRDL